MRLTAVSGFIKHFEKEKNLQNQFVIKPFVRFALISAAVAFLDCCFDICSSISDRVMFPFSKA